MKVVAGIKFKGTEKIYYFSPGDLSLTKGDKVIVESDLGEQVATVEIPFHEIEENTLKKLSSIKRLATDKDLIQYSKNNSDALVALKKARDIVEKSKLKMQLIGAEYTFDRNRLTFNFLADNRIDFRELVKELATEFKTRIELRQIGVRDKAKQVGGIGQCGRVLCCSSFLNDLDTVSINMAKNQNIALNPSKINGVCGRLLCCLKYEDETYKECRKCLPKIGSFVDTKEGQGKVISVDVLKNEYRVLLKNNNIINVEGKKNGCC